MMWWKVKNEMPSGNAMENGPIGKPSDVTVSAKKFVYLKKPSSARFATIVAVMMMPRLVAT